MKNGMLQSLIVLALLPIVLQGCSSRSQPAPVDTLYTGKTYRDFQPNSLNAKKYEVQKGETLEALLKLLCLHHPRHLFKMPQAKTHHHKSSWARNSRRSREKATTEPPNHLRVYEKSHHDKTSKTPQGEPKKLRVIGQTEDHRAN